MASSVISLITGKLVHDCSSFQTIAYEHAYSTKTKQQMSIKVNQVLQLIVFLSERNFRNMIDLKIQYWRSEATANLQKKTEHEENCPQLILCLKEWTTGMFTPED